MSRRVVLWEPWNAPGAEYLELIVDETGVDARGSMIRFIHGEPTRVEYAMACDSSWRVCAVRVTCRGRTLTLEPRQLNAADDVDLYACAFTNTLPIRRTNFADDFTINALFINLPDLRLEHARQHYTRIGERTYRYTGLDTGFVGEITVDEDGLVVDYTSVVRRVWPRSS